MRLMIASSLILLTLSGCGKDSPAQNNIQPIKPLIDTFCSSYTPVYTSDKDSPQTRHDVDKNNAVWLERGCDPNWHETPPATTGTPH